jgi:putative membrane protein
MMFWYGNGMNGWGYVLMAVGMVLLWGLLVLAVMASIRYLRRREQATASRPAAEQVLAERFAHGDGDEPEYRQRLDVLHGSARSDVSS